MRSLAPVAPALTLVLAAAAAAQEPALVENRGQWDPPTRYVIAHGGMQTWIVDGGWTTRIARSTPPANPGAPGMQAHEPPITGTVLHTMLVGAAGPLDMTATEPVPGRHHYFLGNDPARWATALPGHRRLRCADALPGVDLHFRVRADGVLAYDLEFAPHADPGAVTFRIDGHQGLAIADDGSLRVLTSIGELRHTAPVAWSEAGQDRVPVACRFVLRGQNGFGFATGPRDPGLRLVIDPGLVFATFLGGTGIDFPGFPDAIDRDISGDLLVSGNFNSTTNYPYTAGAFQQTGAVRDGFVTRITSTGALVWSAHIGGDQIDRVNGVRVRPDGTIALAGRTSSSTWPVTPGAFQTSYGGGARDGFCAQLSADGGTLLWSTYLGGTADDVIIPFAIAPGGEFVVGGGTDSTDFPTTTGVLQPARAGSLCAINADGFLAVLQPGSGPGQLIASTYLGGGCQDYVQFLDLDNGDIVAGGGTESSDFPLTANAHQTTRSGNWDGVIVKLPMSLAGLTYSTLLGWSGDEDARIRVAGPDRIAVGGWTTSRNLPTTPGAFQPAYGGGGDDGYVGVLDLTMAPAAQLTYLTYLGGTLEGGINAVAVERSGLITVAGNTTAANHPTTAGCLQATLAGGLWDVFVARIDPAAATGQQLVYGSFLGGAMSYEYSYGMTLAEAGAAALAINAGSPDFPVTTGPVFGGAASDAAVAVLDMLPNGVIRYGGPSPVCHGPCYLAVNSEPSAGNAAFEVQVNEAPAGALGALVLGVPDLGGTPVPGAGVWAWVVVPPPASLILLSDARGFARAPVAIPPGIGWPFGGLQSVWLDPSGCAPIVASDALR